MKRTVRIALATLLLSAVAIAGPPTAAEGTVPSADGVPIHYTVAGEGPLALVFVHGWSCDGTFWAEQVAAFSTRYRVVTIDLAGHGQSGRERKTWSIEAFGQDVRAVVEKLDLKRVILIGHSMGGHVVVAAAGVLPDRVAAVIGVDTMQDIAREITPEMLAPYIAQMKADFPTFTRAFVHAMFPSDTDSALVRRTADKMASAPPEIAIPVFQGIFAYDLKAGCAALKAPLREINSAHEATKFVGNAKYAADFDAVVIEGWGHFPQLDHAAQFDGLLAEMIAPFEAKGEAVKVAVIGAGLMGRPLAARLLDAGHEVAAYNRTAARLEPLRARGARIAATAAAALADADVGILMLKDGPSTERTLFGGAVAPRFAGRTVIQMGTIAPGESLELHRRVTVAGGDYLEAPVLGSIPQVEAGQLAILVGATDAQFARWEPLLKTFGPRPVLVGPVGQAALAKLAFNQLMASHIAAFSLFLGLARRSGLDADQLLEILRGTVLHAAVFDRKLPLLRARSFADPHFTTSTLLKDVDLMIDASRAAGLDPVALDGVRAALARAIETGHADEDYASVYEVIDPRT